MPASRCHWSPRVRGELLAQLRKAVRRRPLPVRIVLLTVAQAACQRRRTSRLLRPKEGRPSATFCARAQNSGCA